MKQTPLCLTLLLVVSSALGHDLHPLTAASTFFSQLLYQKIALNESTIAYSPYSIHTILSMITLGSTGTTYNQLATTIGIGSLPHDFICNGYGVLIKELYCLPGFNIISLNILLVPPSTSLLAKYLEVLRLYYYTSVAKYDYVAIGGPERVINEFVERKTNGYIPGLLPTGYIHPDTSLLGLSLFYLNATWREPFDPSRTTRKEFINVCEIGTQVELMNDIRYVNVGTNILSSSVLELPFYGDRISFYAVLPNQLEGLSQLEGSLTNPNSLNQLFTGLKRSLTKISLPKFKVLSKFSLRQPLQQLGINHVFTERAELSGIAQSHLRVTQVVHSQFFEISEIGTIPIPTLRQQQQQASSQQSSQITFNADRPFLFFVRDNLSQQLLVQGKFSG